MLSLLTLVPLSCIVTPIRESENIFFSKSATTMTAKKMSFVKVKYMDVNNVYGRSPDNYYNVRGLTKYPANFPSLDIMSVTKGLVDYAG